MHNLSGHPLQFIVTFIIKTSVLLSRVLGKNCTFCSMGLQGASLCSYCFCAGISMPWFYRSAIGLLRKKCNFQIPWFHSTMNIKTQNVRKKILHALHFKWKFLIKYFSSYIKKCQTGTYFFWVEYIMCVCVWLCVEVILKVKLRKSSSVWFCNYPLDICIGPI